jgi:hypothetical protein
MDEKWTKNRLKSRRLGVQLIAVRRLNREIRSQDLFSEMILFSRIITGCADATAIGLARGGWVAVYAFAVMAAANRPPGVVSSGAAAAGHTPDGGCAS